MTKTNHSEQDKPEIENKKRLRPTDKLPPEAFGSQPEDPCADLKWGGKEQIEWNRKIIPENWIEEHDAAVDEAVRRTREQSNQWISVKDRLPTEEDAPHGFVWIRFWYDGLQHQAISTFPLSENVSDWATITPPKP